MSSLQSSLRGMLFLYFIIAAWGCFITNCPPGGKRSESKLTRTNELRECKSCGPPGVNGRCYGPNICCIPKFGCLFGTPETYSCNLEGRYKTLCRNPGAPCNGNKNLGTIIGQCTVDGICCNSETCTFDANCQENTAENLSRSAIRKTFLSMVDDGIQRPSSGEPIVWHHFNLPIYETLMAHDQGQLRDDPDPNPISTSQGSSLQQ